MVVDGLDSGRNGQSSLLLSASCKLLHLHARITATNASSRLRDPPPSLSKPCYEHCWRLTTSLPREHSHSLSHLDSFSPCVVNTARPSSSLSSSSSSSSSATTLPQPARQNGHLLLPPLVVLIFWFTHQELQRPKAPRLSHLLTDLPASFYSYFLYCVPRLPCFGHDWQHQRQSKPPCVHIICCPFLLTHSPSARPPVYVLPHHQPHQHNPRLRPQRRPHKLRRPLHRPP